MFGNDFYNSNRVFPILYNIKPEEENIKMSHDSFDVYVNEEYIGKKIFLTQSEKPSDVEAYLKDRGFHNFNSSISGDHILINSAFEESDEIKRNLHIYLTLR